MNTVRRRPHQRGASLVELIVAMAITGLVLVGLIGVVLVTENVSQAWDHRVGLAAANTALPASLQADVHRFVPCAANGSTPTLNLCEPDGKPAIAYAYAAASGQIVRSDAATGRTDVIVRRLDAAANPAFSVLRTQAVSSCAGYVLVQGLRYPGDATTEPDLYVYFRSAASSACT
ncbi:MAG: prepilin-type N-terminal cleavage/methylation domain-containing protein [Candidatus Dormibacteraeota bacterium]|nr:prepilin-type N-terminal cleavage/methylation domain-containing protein [Candidatus Dormibacteraeota bacterium]